MEITLIISFVLFLMFFLTGLLEKQHIQQFVPADVNPAGQSPYFQAMNADAAGLEFKPLGTFRQERDSKTYRAILAFWISPDRLTLARIGGGKTLGFRIRRTTLISRLGDGQFLETADDYGSADLSALSLREVVLNAHLSELWQRHRERLAAAESSPLPFGGGNVLAMHEEMETAKAERLIQLGLARPLNLPRTIWRYTAKGAWQQYVVGFRRQLADGKKQAARVRLKRPGDA